MRNCADGTVEVVAEGEAPAITEFQAWCRKGPPGARVDSVTQLPLPPEEPLTAFSVR